MLKPNWRSTITTILLLTTGVAAPLAADQPELIPIDVLFGNPTKTQGRISPDGKWVSYLAPSEEDVLNVWVQPIDGGEAKMVTNDTYRGIRTHFWAEDSTHVIYLQDLAGDENWHVYLADLETEVVRDLTPFQGIRAQNVITDRNHPNEILVGLNLRDRGLFDMYRVDLTSGALTPDSQNPGDVIDWLTDPEFRIRGAFAQNAKDGSNALRVRDSLEEEWRDLITWPFGENGSPVGFAKDGESIYVESSLGSDTTRLVRVDTQNGEELEALAHDPRSDIGEILVDEVTHTIQAVEMNHLKSEWIIIDPALEADFKVLNEAFRGNFGVLARDRADQTWIVYHEADQDPLAYYAYHRSTQKIDKLFDSRPDLAQYTLAEMKPVVIKARDGMDLVSYLTVPDDRDAKGLPLVLNPHGGPWDRDSWGYDSWSQWFANRGYAVLQVNFRGSVGFGKKFLNAGNKEWGVGHMQHDLTDAVKWAIDEGIADPEKVAIIGGSYGGYATLAGLTFTPDLYTCGVDIVGMSNMKTAFESIPPYWETFKKELVLRVGDAENDDELNRKISPLFHVDNIKVPLLIGQGANDPRVNINESNQIVEAMRAKKLPVTYIVYTDEGHGFARPENRLDFYGRTDEFMAQCLGGRHQPFQEVEGTSAELP